MDTKKLFYGGMWHDAASTRTIYNPATGEQILIAGEADATDTENAIAAAREAFASGCWSELSVYERAAIFIRTAELIEENADEIDRLEADDSGKLYAHTRGEAFGAAYFFRSAAAIIGQPSGQTFNNRNDLFSMTIKQPIGVCAAIIPWNYPLYTAAMSITMPLAAGNTVVLKPASITPVTTIFMVELMEKAGFPGGAINLVTGSGEVVGGVLAKSPSVDQIILTGGTDTGKCLMADASVNLKRLELELGGKSPIILFSDFDIDIAIDNVLTGINTNAGQLCTASSRLIVEENIYDEVADKIARASDKLKLGFGADEEASVCTLISEDHMNKVLSYIEKGKAEGARLVSGGFRDVEGDLSKGFFVRPTVFADVTQDMTIAQEEIFGPVLVIEKFKDIGEAIDIANDTIYGLAGGVFTNSFENAQQVIKRLRCGALFVNNYLDGIPEPSISPAKQSGIGRIGGIGGIESFLETKLVNISLSPGMTGLFTG